MPVPSQRSMVFGGGTSSGHGGSTGSAPALRGRLSLGQFVTAGLSNLAASCRYKFWVDRRVAPSVPLGLNPSSGEFVDFILALQQFLGLPETGAVDGTTWPALVRHAAANTPTGQIVKTNITLTAERNALPVKFCGEAAARRNIWSVTEADKQRARTEQARAEQRFGRQMPVSTNRNVVEPLGAMTRQQNSTTEIYGLPYGKVLEAVVYNTYAAALPPQARTAYAVDPAAKLGLRALRRAPHPLRSVSDPQLVLLVGQWQLSKGAQPFGQITPNTARGMKMEMEARESEWGRRFAEVIAFQMPRKVTLTAEERRNAAKRGIRSAGVVSNLQPQLVRAQSNATEAMRLANQTVRGQYDRAGGAATSSASVLDQRQTNIVSDLSRVARQRTAATAGRGGFVNPNIALDVQNANLNRGAGLMSVLNPAVPRSAWRPEAAPGVQTPAPNSGMPPPSHDTEVETVSADVRLESGDQPGASSGGDGGPTPYTATDHWSSATSEEIAAAQKEEDTSWAFDESAAGPASPEQGGPRGARNANGGDQGPDGGDGGSPIDGEVVPGIPTVTAPKASGKKLLVVGGALVGLWFLFRK